MHQFAARAKAARQTFRCATGLRGGSQDIMIAGGAEELSPADAAVFDSLFFASILNETLERTPRAYDKKRDGLVVGEGAATLILEEWEHAARRMR